MYDGIELKKWSDFNRKIYPITSINDELSLLKGLNPDLIIMCGWRQILSREILVTPKHGVIGFHPTLLPAGRGPAPIINTILKGFDETGVTMYHVSEKLDDGDISPRRNST